MSLISVNQHELNRYHTLEKEIEKLKSTLQIEQQHNEERQQYLLEIQQKWLPTLQSKIELISKKFSKFFHIFHANGRIELKPPLNGEQSYNYNEWEIKIMTKFRNDQPWKQLSSSAQSGGEKSVATMLYLLSLQEVTTVPFRVVDEINQGMDPTNERRIMNILNQACTPKKK